MSIVTNIGPCECCGGGGPGTGTVIPPTACCPEIGLPAVLYGTRIGGTTTTPWPDPIPFIYDPAGFGGQQVWKAECVESITGFSFPGTTLFTRLWLVCAAQGAWGLYPLNFGGGFTSPTGGTGCDPFELIFPAVNVMLLQFCPDDVSAPIDQDSGTLEIVITT